nr:reverse transcriptase domain-containing protein [Tanacetum cinerariifolium]
MMPKFGPSIKSLLTNKDKLCELAGTPLNEHCSMVLLKKLPKILGDPGKFLIPCDFPRMAECIVLADLDASINLMPLSVWNKLTFLDLSPTCMTLELVDRLISLPVEVAEDRSFLKTERALIDMFEGELTLRVGKEAVTFNLDQTSRYSTNYNDMTANRIDVIDMAFEEYSQEVLGFSDVIASGNPTSYYDPIVSTTSPTLTPFGNSDFLLEEVDSFLALEDDPSSPEVDQSYVDTEGGILLLEAFLNDDLSLPPPNQGNYLPQVRKELKLCGDKLPVIIAKDLSVEEKTALITILKSHKRAIAWKLSDIKDKEVPLSEGSPVIRTKSYMETYKNVSQDIRDQLNAEAEAVQIITRIDNDIYSTVDACPNACKMLKAIERSQQAAIRNKGKAIVNSPQPIYDQEPSMVAEDDETSKEKEIDKIMDLISLSFKKIYKPTNNNLRTSSNTNRANQDNSSRINRSTGYETQRIGNVAGARETVGSTVVQKSRIQCYNCKEHGHVARECQKPKRAKDASYHREKMLLCKQEEARIQLNAEQADWKDDTDDECDDQELEAHYMYMAKLQQ